MRELFPVIRREKKTVREGDRVKVASNYGWTDCVVVGVKDNIVVVRNVNWKPAAKRSWWNRGVINGGRLVLDYNSPDWKRDPLASQREREARRAAHNERVATDLAKRVSSVTKKKPPKVQTPVAEEESAAGSRKLPKSKPAPAPAQVTVTSNLVPRFSTLPDPRISWHPEAYHTPKKVIVYGSARDRRFNWKTDHSNPEAASLPSNVRHQRKLMEQERKHKEEEQMLKKLRMGQKKYGETFWLRLKDEPGFATKILLAPGKAGESAQKPKLTAEERRIVQLFSIHRDKFDIQDQENYEASLIKEGYAKHVLEEDYFVHILDTRENCLRMEEGPKTLFVAPTEQIIVGPKKRYSDWEDVTPISEEEALENLKLVGTTSPNLDYFEHLEHISPSVDYRHTSASPETNTEESYPVERVKWNNECSARGRGNRGRGGRGGRGGKGKGGRLAYYSDDDIYSDDDAYSTASEGSIDEQYETCSEYEDEDGEYIILTRGNVLTGGDLYVENQSWPTLEDTFVVKKSYDYDENPFENSNHEYSYDYFGSNTVPYEDPYQNGYSTFDKNHVPLDLTQSGELKMTDMYDGVDPFYNDIVDETIEAATEDEPEEIKKLRIIYQDGFMTPAEFNRRRKRVIAELLRNSG